MSGQLGLRDVPVQVPGLDPVALGAVGDGGGALEMENGVALGTLGDALQVEGVDRGSVPADLTDEALALAQDAGQDVLPAEPGGVAK